MIARAASTLFGVSLLSACALSPASLSRSQIVWPAPPEVGRIAYEITLTGRDSIQPGPSELEKLLAGESQIVAQPSLIKPYDVAAFGGLIAVTDTQARVVFVFDIPRRKFFPIGWRNEGQLAQPLGVAIDHNRNIYVADGLQNRVHVYNELGHYIRSIGDPKDFSHLADVAVDMAGKQIFLLDRGGVESDWHRIRVYDATTGAVIRSIGGRGKENGSFNHPIQVCVSLQNELIVFDAGNFRVQIFDLDGNFRRSFGKVGDGLGQFARGRGIAVSNEGYILTTDAAFQNFQIYSASGQLLLAVGQSGDGQHTGDFLLPAGIAVDDTNRIYVVDQLLRKVDVFRFIDENSNSN